MITYKNFKSTVHVPIKGPFMQMKGIKILKIEENHEHDPGFPNYVRRLPERVFKLPRPDQPQPDQPQPAPASGPMIAKKEQLRRIRRLRRVVYDDSGHLYERVNGKLRPLREVVVDDYNRLHEVISEKIPSQSFPLSLSPYDNDYQAEEIDRSKMASQDETHPPANNNHQPGRPVPAAYEKIFADPGLHIRVAFGPFMKELGIHLYYPERCSPEAALECSLQIYQLRRPFSLQHLAAIEMGDARYAWMFRPLTREKAEVLGVPELFIEEYAPANGAGNRSPAGHQRLYFIKPVSDPTVATTADGSEYSESNAPMAENPNPSNPAPKHDGKGLRNLFRVHKKN